MRARNHAKRRKTSRKRRADALGTRKISCEKIFRRTARKSAPAGRFRFESRESVQSDSAADPPAHAAKAPRRVVPGMNFGRQRRHDEGRTRKKKKTSGTMRRPRSTAV